MTSSTLEVAVCCSNASLRHSMVRRAPTAAPAVAPVIAPELRPRRRCGETKRERNGDAYANGWHGRYHNPDTA